MNNDIEKRKHLFIDIEVTRDRKDICSIAIIQEGLKTLLHTPFHTNQILEDNKITQLGFCREDLIRAPKFETLKPILLEVFRGKKLHFWNAAMDIKWFPEIKSLGVEHICEMKRFCELSGVKKWQKTQRGLLLTQHPKP